MSAVTVIAYDANGAPLAGLSPTWASLHNALTGTTIAPPPISEVGGGVYRSTLPDGVDAVGVVDFGASASPRYGAIAAVYAFTFVAYDAAGAPLAGLSPTWASCTRADGTAVSPTPEITEIGGGIYRVAAQGLHTVGVIDLGAAATPRYVFFEAGEEHGFTWSEPSPPAAAAVAATAKRDLFGTDIRHGEGLDLGHQGDYLTFGGVENLRAAVYRRLITAPGEFKLRPEYGVGVAAYVKRRLTPAVLDDLAQRTRDQLLQDPRISDATVTATIETRGGQPGLAMTVSVQIAGQEQALPFFFTE